MTYTLSAGMRLFHNSARLYSTKQTIETAEIIQMKNLSSSAIFSKIESPLTIIVFHISNGP